MRFTTLILIICSGFLVGCAEEEDPLNPLSSDTAVQDYESLQSSDAVEPLSQPNVEPLPTPESLPEPESQGYTPLLEDMVDSFDRFNKTLESIKSKDHAEAKTDNLHESLEEMIAVMKKLEALGEPGAEELEKLEDVYKPKFQAAGQAIGENLRQIREADVTALPVLRPVLEAAEGLKDVTPKWLR